MADLKLPKDFLWGFATASYQIEGAANEDGRADSIWDTFCRQPGKIADGSNGDVACDSYHRYAEDIAILKQLGARAYRFSISWSRVIPLGGRDDPINEEGLLFYSRVVDLLLAEGIEPMVTLFHWDLPQQLQDRYRGFLTQEEFVLDFARYARLIFETLGDRVRFWITFNEPWIACILGHSVGIFAPGRSSDRSRSSEGDSSTEPWRVGKSLLVAHGSVVKMYRDEFKTRQGGKIGITLNGDWAEPWDMNDSEDVAAAQRKLEFSIAWFADPIYRGEYPRSMREQLGERLPGFTAEERAVVYGSNDFYGMNTYSTDYIRHRTSAPDRNDFSGNVDMLKTNSNGESVGPESGSEWLRPHPAGFRKLLSWISKRYDYPTIYVTENGTSIKGESEMTLETVLDDEFRVKYFRDHIRALTEARNLDRVDVRGYMAWSLLDNFEWADGYRTRFGVVYVDYEHEQARHVKRSAGVVREIFDELCVA